MIDFAALEEPLRAVPLFPVEPPDDQRSLAELPRQTRLLSRLRVIAPGLKIYANANAGKRNPTQARREGITSGVFDLSVVNREAYPRFRAELEMKGWASKRAGKLSPNQISWGNDMHRAGWPVACFFTPDAAVAWLRSLAPWAFIDREGRL